MLGAGNVQLLVDVNVQQEIAFIDDRRLRCDVLGRLHQEMLLEGIERHPLKGNPGVSKPLLDSEEPLVEGHQVSIGHNQLDRR